MRGTLLPSLVKPPITRELLNLYAEASTDNNPIHLDDSVAKAAGLPGVIAHGMLTMAFMGEFLHQALVHLNSSATGRIIEMSCRFKAMTFPGDIVTISGSVHSNENNTVHCDLEAKNQKGEVTATGHASLQLS
jgi:acyl dehydratase